MYSTAGIIVPSGKCLASRNLSAPSTTCRVPNASNRRTPPRIPPSTSPSPRRTEILAAPPEPTSRPSLATSQAPHPNIVCRASAAPAPPRAAFSALHAFSLLREFLPALPLLLLPVPQPAQTPPSHNPRAISSNRDSHPN